jgi:SAM-dependent methyltransferase
MSNRSWDVEVLVSAGDEPFAWDQAEKDLMGEIDTTVPVSARIWNYWMGGKDYYQVDEEVGDQFLAVYPGIADMARSSRLFISRVVTYLARDTGIRQFLDIGTGLPSNDNTHEVALRIAPDCRVVYVDNDPLVLTHARALLTGTQGTTDYIDGDLNKPADIIRAARGKLDFSQPVAIMLMGILGHIGNPEEDDDQFARSVVEQLKQALPAGGYLALYEAANTNPAYNEAIRIYNETGAVPYHLRSVGQITRFFDGLEAADPGIVPIQKWRPDERVQGLPEDVDAWGGVAVKQ